MKIPEQWRQFRDTQYWVSDQGRLKRIYSNGRERLLKGMTKKGKNGKPSHIEFKVDNKQLKLKDMIWETFRFPKPRGACLYHKNGLYRDNSLFNLAIIEKAELSRITNKRKLRSIINLDSGVVSRGLAKAGQDNYCSDQEISDICRGKRKKPCVNVAWWDAENEIAYRGEYRYECED